MATLIGVSAWLSLTLARGPGELSAVWIGNGILTGWLLSRSTRLWPGYIGQSTEAATLMSAADAALYAAKKAGRNTCSMQCVDDAETGGRKADAQKG